MSIFPLPARHFLQGKLSSWLSATLKCLNFVQTFFKCMEYHILSPLLLHPSLLLLSVLHLFWSLLFPLLWVTKEYQPILQKATSCSIILKSLMSIFRSAAVETSFYFIKQIFKLYLNHWLFIHRHNFNLNSDEVQDERYYLSIKLNAHNKLSASR